MGFTQETGNTSEKNRSIIDSIRRKGKERYEQFKACLNETNQSMLVEILEHHERGEEPPKSLLTKVFEKTKREGTTSKTDNSPEDRQKQAYLQMKTNLKDDLITFYRRSHRTIRLSPLLEEDAPLLKYYVTPVIKLIKIKTVHGCGRKEEDIPISSVHDLFYNEGKICSEVYLSADAGFGKTSLSKRLALTWCQAKKPTEDENGYFSNEDLTAINEFDFLFLLQLRECSNICEIDAMIRQQNISWLAHKLSIEDLDNILSRERYLIILDGLDEWLHPSKECEQGYRNLPHQKIRENITVLTTTRPWKLSVLGSELSQDSHKLEISGLNQDSAEALKKSVLTHLLEKSEGIKEREEEINKSVCSFTKKLRESDISELEASPLLLMYLLFVWHAYKKLGNTQCEIYSEIVELLLSRTVGKQSNVKEVLGSIPHCFNGLNYCRKFYGHLTSLGKLAFNKLLKERKENTLVFDSIEAESYLESESLLFYLNSGILTQSKEYKDLMRQTTKMAFSHKSIQEYFAALYMSSSANPSSVFEVVKSKCKCIKDILEISKILLFISGFNPRMSSKISHELSRILNDDEITSKYRSSVDMVKERSLTEYQDLCVSCCKEMSEDNKASLYTEDVFIDDSCKQEQYCQNLRFLTKENKQNIKSVYIDMYGISYKTTHEVIDYFSLTGLDNLEKIWYFGEYISDIVVLLKTSVRCLCLYSPSILSHSRLPCKEVTNLNKLEVIDICEVLLSHSELTEFYNYISRTKCLRQIKLENLHCTDHGQRRCPGSRLTFVQHSQLRTLTLRKIALTEMEINLATLEKFELERLSDPDPVLKFINQPEADSNQPENPHVKLFMVTTAASSLEQFLDVIQTIESPVQVDIEKCKIEPEDEFTNQIDRIKTSQNFTMQKEL